MFRQKQQEQQVKQHDLNKRHFSKEELDLLYLDVLVPYSSSNQYDIVFDRLLEQFEVHEAFHLPLIELFVSSACHINRSSTVAQLFSHIQSKLLALIQQQKQSQSSRRNHESTRDDDAKTAFESSSDLFSIVYQSMMLQYGMAKLLWKVREYVQCFLLCKSILREISRLDQKRDGDEHDDLLVVLESKLWYLMAKINFEFYTGGDVVLNDTQSEDGDDGQMVCNVVEQFNLCISQCFHLSDQQSVWRVWSKMCEFYVVTVVLNRKFEQHLFKQEERENLEYAKWNIVIAMQQFMLTNANSHTVQYSRMKMRKLTSKLSLINLMRDDNNTGFPKILAYDRLLLFTYLSIRKGQAIFDNTNGDEESLDINDISDRFYEYYQRKNSVRHFSLNELRSVGINVSARSKQWERLLEYSSLVLQFCPTIDPSAQFYHCMALFHQQYPALFEITSSVLGEIGNVEFSTILPSAPQVNEFDNALLGAKRSHVSCNLQQSTPITLYLTVLRQLNQIQAMKNRGTFNPSVYLFIATTSQIRFECHAIVGIRLSDMTKRNSTLWRKAVYHLYKSLLLSQGNSSFIWRLWISLLKKHVRDNDPTLYVKALFLYINQLREEQSQENTELLMKLQEELNILNSGVSIVPLDETSYIRLQHLSSEHTLKDIMSDPQITSFDVQPFLHSGL